MSLRPLAMLCFATGAAGCIASNVVAHDDRMVAAAVADLQFTAATAGPAEGLYESVEITGDAAVSLRRVYYVFFADGTYTAAALTEADGRSAFQTLTGTWAFSTAGLSLDGAEPVRFETAPDHLRITAPNGALVLRRSRLQ